MSDERHHDERPDEREFKVVGTRPIRPTASTR